MAHQCNLSGTAGAEIYFQNSSQRVMLLFEIFLLFYALEADDENEGFKVYFSIRSAKITKEYTKYANCYFSPPHEEISS